MKPEEKSAGAFIPNKQTAPRSGSSKERDPRRRLGGVDVYRAARVGEIATTRIVTIQGDVSKSGFLAGDINARFQPQCRQRYCTEFVEDTSEHTGILASAGLGANFHVIVGGQSGAAQQKASREPPELR